MPSPLGDITLTGDNPVVIEEVSGDVYIVPYAPRVIRSGEVTAIQQGPVRGGAGGLPGRGRPFCPPSPPAPAKTGDAFADFVNGNNLESRTDMMCAVTKTYLTGAMVGALAIRNALDDAKFDLAMGRLSSALSKSRPIPKVPLPRKPQSVFTVSAITPPFEGGIPARDLWRSISGGIINLMPPGSGEVRFNEAENSLSFTADSGKLVEITRILASVSPDLVVSAKPIPLPENPEVTAFDAGESALSQLSDIGYREPGALPPSSGGVGGGVGGGAGTAPIGGGPVKPPTGPLPMPGPVTPGPEKPEEPTKPTEPGPPRGGGGGGGSGGGGSGGGGEDEGGDKKPPSTQEDSCGCYCSKDMEVASQGGPAGLPLTTGGVSSQFVYTNKKCGGYYLMGSLNLDGSRNWIPYKPRL